MAISENSPEQNSNPSILSAEAIPASRSARPGNEPANGTCGIFGPSLLDCFAFFDPDTSCWKTSQATFLSGLDQYSETWPDSGSMRSGRVYERVMSELPTSESVSSSWPTARGEANHWNTPSTEDVSTWRTITACSENSLRGSGQNAEARKAQGHMVNIQDQVNSWEPSRPAQPTNDGPPSSESAPTSRRRLNPRFVEWLMGFPVTWTEL